VTRSWVLCVAASHPLAGKPSVTLDQLQEHVELTVQDSSEQGDDRHMFGGERVFYLSDFSVKKKALLMGVGFGWIPRTWSKVNCVPENCARCTTPVVRAINSHPCSCIARTVHSASIS
jgi:DNA-binding transcriptional LysR family regulator